MSHQSMLLSTLAQQDDLSLQQTLSLNTWYSFDDSPLVASQQSEQPLAYVSVFGFQLGMHVAQLAQQLRDWQCQVQAVVRYHADDDLPPGFAFAIANPQAELNSQLKQYAAENAVQCALLSNPPRLHTPGLLVMDMDSTAITIECIDEIARLAGVYDEVAAVTAQAMGGQLEFSDSLRQRVAKLAGVELSLLAELKEQLPLMPGIDHLCATLKRHNWHLAIASGGFIPFAEQVQKQLKLDRIHANQLADDGLVLTGVVNGDIVDAQEKARFLLAYRDELGVGAEQTVAIGDGANDLLMMHAAGLGVAVHGKPKVVAQAPTAINAGSLAQILYLLSIPAFN